MKHFPSNAFEPEPGKLNQLIFENPERGIAPRLEYSIELPFAPFELVDDADEISTVLRLSGIQAEAKSWRELEGKSANVRLSDGAIRLFDAHNPVELTSLTFGALSGTSIAVSLEISIDFELEGDPDYGEIERSLSAELEIGPLRVATSINKRFGGDEQLLAAEIGGVASLADYGPLTKAPGGLEYPLLG